MIQPEFVMGSDGYPSESWGSREYFTGTGLWSSTGLRWLLDVTEEALGRAAGRLTLYHVKISPSARHLDAFTPDLCQCQAHSTKKGPERPLVTCELRCEPALSSADESLSCWVFILAAGFPCQRLHSTQSAGSQGRCCGDPGSWAQSWQAHAASAQETWSTQFLLLYTLFGT